MVSFKFAALALAALRAVSVHAQGGLSVEDASDTIVENAPTGKLPSLNVDVQVSFPDAEIFGVKLVNGRPTRALLAINNNEETDVSILLATGSLLTPKGVPGAPDPSVTLRNLTMVRYGHTLPSKSKETFTYTFSSEMHPADVTLDIKLLVQRGDAIYTLQVYQENVSVVEAPVSIFDPQIIFLYLFLAGAFAGTCYFIYSTWITTLFPQKKRAGKGGERAKRSSGGSKKVDPTDQVSVAGAEGPAVTTGSKAYDESWIPATHLKRPEPKRVSSGRPKSKAAA